ncbi:NAD(P)H-hydrate dehydratase [Dietzia sp. PP-33]|uniref:NAD(P)H-hydrate dehydratase n=1 Tax=Dietzia sp. PP-33 TaxID=2957500 RepID=UPI0029A394BF|nr:NAD(P)H-hydrate dehydratase [Dietzia sp. PP-33]MDX2357334.1 NAD(P)H-hydrate dehydratase [Dietzia sp. PP-33]
MTGDQTVLTTHRLREWPLPSPGGGKNGRGRVLVVGGSRSTPGAIVLAGEAALRGGAGTLQILTVDSVAGGIALRIPESRVIGLPETGAGEVAPGAAELICELAADCDAVVVGPGIGDTDAAVALLADVIPRLQATLVVDALALAYITEYPDGVAHLDGRAVLSPNPRELARTLGVPEDEIERDTPGHVVELARRTGAVVVSGTATSWIASPDGRVWRDESGIPALGVSGSGDVKAGVVAAMLARGAEPAQAAAWATYAHGRAGERLAVGVGPTGFLARELLSEFPRVLAELSA